MEVGNIMLTHVAHGWHFTTCPTCMSEQVLFPSYLSTKYTADFSICSILCKQYRSVTY